MQFKRLALSAATLALTTLPACDWTTLVALNSDTLATVNIKPAAFGGGKLAQAGRTFMSTSIGTISPSGYTCNNSAAPATLVSQIATQNVGPFNVTATRAFNGALTNTFANLKARTNIFNNGSSGAELYGQLSSAGGFCFRRIANSTSPSNHAWGTALDVKVSGKLDGVGNATSMAGNLALAQSADDYLIYWGGAFSGSSEDGMHYEYSQEGINWSILVGALKHI